MVKITELLEPICTAVILSLLAIIGNFCIKDLRINKYASALYLLVVIFNLATSCVIFNIYHHSIYYYALMLMLNLLLMAAIIDYRTKYIPDLLLLPLLALGLFTAFVIPGTVFYNPLISSLVLGLVLLLINKKTRDSLGMGDVKLVSCLALFFGYPKIGSIIFIALLLGLVYGLIIMFRYKKNIKTEIPFIPFVFLGTLLVVLI